MPQQKLTIVPVTLHPEKNNSSTPIPRDSSYFA